ncbi:beta-galactosidase [Trifolium pratense]|uniref:Beta-galactosidase n=1 Tax=Trifolium pratense TaxID=57577 RepID=A0A2K3LZ68_TRIPR|nr:beta-galactosidase [Trifolium pratense]
MKYPMSHYVSNQNLSESNKSFANQLSVISIPNSVQDALADPKWKAAMNEEMNSLQKNETWDLVDCPKGKKPVGCRWVYTVKYKPDGEIERYKARLVAKGYTQAYGIDYTETFAPVAKINTVRVLLSLAANFDWPLQQFDVKNAFLHGELLEEVYMDLPPGCNKSERHAQKVCKLKKSLYGLKQSPRAWFGRFTKSMIAFGYVQSNSDHTLFLKKQQGKITALIIYVDDMVVTGNDPEERKALQEHLSREFEMKDLGFLKYFLGIEVSRSKKGIFLSQRKYALDLLQETGMSACQPATSPMEEGLKLHNITDQVSCDKGRYQRLVGKLMYLAHTRPDLAYALSIVSQFMHNPCEQHMNAVMHILRYLKSAPGKGILFTKNEKHEDIDVYTDADWAGALDDRRSTSGYFSFVGGNLVTWRSKKQNVVARSSAEAEFRGMALGLCEALWLKHLLEDLGYPQRQPIHLYCDNKAACDIAHNPVQHDRTKHVEVDRFFIKEKLDAKILELPKIRSEDQLADMLTKAVSSKVFLKYLHKLGMDDIYAPT